MSDNDWSTDPINETLPAFAGPNDSAIVIGTDLPPCMQARYSGAIFFRPPNTVTSGITGGIWRFMAQRKTQASTEEGYLLYDQTSICGFVVSRVLLGANDTFGNIGVLEQFTPNFAGGSSAYVPNAFKWQIVGNTASGLTAAMLFGDVGTHPSLTPFLIDGVSADRGTRGWVASRANSGFAAAEAVFLATGNITFATGRAYSIEVKTDLESTVANAFVNIMIRRTNIAGVIIRNGAGFTMAPVVGFGVTAYVNTIVKNSTAADITDILVATMQPFIGASQCRADAAADRPMFIKVTDIGAATGFANATDLV